MWIVSLHNVGVLPYSEQGICRSDINWKLSMAVREDHRHSSCCNHGGAVYPVLALCGRKRSHTLLKRAALFVSDDTGVSFCAVDQQCTGAIVSVMLWFFISVQHTLSGFDCSFRDNWFSSK